ncbi:MAG: hypothetical protein RI894_2013 [Bacteroidota bacterium]|jgi:preprotein translocase subunit SecY
MNNLIQTLKNIWSIDELRTRILYTLGLLAAYRFATYVVLPGIVPSVLAAANQSKSGASLFGLVNAFSGGAFDNASIMALGIMPYISASIVIQLLGFAVPYFQRLQKREGESGQRLLNQYTRWLTVVIALVQSFPYMKYILSTPNVLNTEITNLTMFYGVGALVITSGTIFAMWLGERITEKGLGNGTSLLIMSGIMSRLPAALATELEIRGGGSGGGLIAFVLELAFLVVVVAITILLVQGVRRIPIQYAKRMVGRNETQGQVNFSGATDNIPIKVNASGVMPIIFAQALMFIPSFIAPLISSDLGGSLANFSKFTSPTYNIVYFILIVVFTYVYTALLVNPNQYSEFLKRSNAFIPGVQPGEETSNFIDAVTARITLPGAIGLGLVAILPAIVAAFGVDQNFALFFGGSSLIILVGVVLDTILQIDGHLKMRRYDSLVRTGKVGRETTADVEAE